MAGDLGYCGLDARRSPLTGGELRGCWQPARPVPPEPPPSVRATGAAARLRGQSPGSGRTFVPLDELVPWVAAAVPDASPAIGRSPAIGAGDAALAERGTLFGEIDA